MSFLSGASSGFPTSNTSITATVSGSVTATIATITESVTALQGQAGSIAQAWFAKLTSDGINIIGSPGFPIVISGSITSTQGVGANNHVNIDAGNITLSNNQSVTATLSQFPATAVLADATSNPTLTKIETFAEYFNGTTWDRVYNNQEFTAQASITITAAATSADVTNYNARGVNLFINTTAISGLNATLTVTVQYKDPVSGSYVSSGTSSTALAATGLVLLQIAATLARTWRLSYAVAGVTPSITFSVGGSYTQ